MSIKLAIYQITAGTKEQAANLSTKLVQNNLVACCNIIENITSVYKWKNQIQSQHQCLIIAKSRLDLQRDIVSFVKNNHTYDQPEIIMTPIIGGSPSYAQWVVANTSNTSKSELQL